MPKIKITKDTVRDASNKMTQAGAEHNAVIQSIERAVSALDQGWEGNAKDAFKRVWEQEGPKFKSFKDDIAKFGQFLKVYLGTMESEDRL